MSNMSDVLEYIQDNLWIVAIAAVALIGLLILAFRKRPKQTKVEPVKVESPVEAFKEPVKEEALKPIAEKEPVKEPKPVVEKEKEEIPSKPVKEASKANESESNEDDDPSKDVVTLDKPAKYHVSQNKDEKSPHYKKWRVRKEGSKKTIKFYETQKEAIEVAEDLAFKAGTTIVIHKVDGSIRKQDYTKK
jgi:uncharacterized protein YdaT